jgi:nitrogen fixation NifU-like protein
MLDLKDLYQEIIVDHNRSPRNFGALPQADRMLEGYNPLCGDRLRLYLKLDGDRIADIRFDGSGCAISVASASLMTEALKGKTVAAARRLFESFHDLVTGKGAPADASQLGKLAALAGVRDYPARVKCATLCWHTLNSALAGKHEPVSTE